MRRRLTWVLWSAMAVACDQTGPGVPAEPREAPAADAPTPEPSAPGQAPAAGEPHAELAARVVAEAGALRYELEASAPQPWVVKSETPFNVTLRPGDGVRLRRSTFDRRDFVDPKAPVKRITSELEADPGERVIEAAAELYVCSAELCKRVNATITTPFTIPRS